MVSDCLGLGYGLVRVSPLELKKVPRMEQRKEPPKVPRMEQRNQI